MDGQRLQGIRQRLAHIAIQIAQNAAFQAKSDRYLDRLEQFLRKEARRERERRGQSAKAKRWNEVMNRLTAAQLLTEEKLQRFLDSQRGTNGKG